MAFDTYLRAAGFTGKDLFEQYPVFAVLPTRYVITSDRTDALVQMWLSDRPGSWFIGVLNLFRQTLDYGLVPRGTPGTIGVAQKYLRDVATWSLWKQEVNFVFTYHPWIDRENPKEDVGVPGILQFLTEFPFCVPTLLDGGKPILKTTIEIPKSLSMPNSVACEPEPEPRSSHWRLVEL